MARLWIFGSLTTAALASTFLLVETRRLAELAGQQEAAARRAEAELARVLTSAPAVVATDARAYADLALELATTQQRLQSVTELLEQRNAEQAKRASAAAAASATRVVPDGVRTCLVALHDQLRKEGFTAQRFLGASAIVDRELRDVELLEVEADQLAVGFVRAARMTAVVDRARSTLELRFFEGERTVGGVATALAKDGWMLRFDAIDGEEFEARLPYLVRGEGQYAIAAAAPTEATVDASTRSQWLERVDRLLDMAGTSNKWRMSRFRGMRDGWFLDVELVATNDIHHVVGGAHCARAAIELDAAAGVVSLRMLDGVLHRDGTASSITGEGYRMLLPKLHCKQASDAMLGIVVTK